MLAAMRRLLPACLLVLSATLAAGGAGDRIWSVEREGFITRDELEARIVAADVILLGEIHDQALHHRRQAELIQALAGHTPGIVFEMLSADQADALAAWQAGPAPDAAELGPAVGWTESGWPPWSSYQPIAEAGLAIDAHFRAGAPAGEHLRSVGGAGLAGLARATRQRLDLDQPLPEAARKRLTARLREAHAGIDATAPIERMLAVQRLRDAAMARALRDAVEDHGRAVLIAGNEHIRRDYGVAFQLAATAPALDVVAIGQFPVRAGVGGRTALPQPPDRAAFDFIWLGPVDGRASGEDPA